MKIVLVAAVATDAYPLWRRANSVFIAGTILGSIVVFGRLAVRGDDPEVRLQSRVCMAGISLGILPFLALTLIPVGLGGAAWAPSRFTVLPLALMPIAFAARSSMLKLPAVNEAVTTAPGPSASINAARAASSSARSSPTTAAAKRTSARPCSTPLSIDASIAPASS